MKKIYYLFFVLLLANGCKRNEDSVPTIVDQGPVLQLISNPVDVPQGDALTRNEINDRIYSDMQTKHDFRYQETNINFVRSVAQYCGLIAVGYKPAGLNDILPFIDKIDIHTKSWQDVHDEMIKAVLADVNKNLTTPLTAEEIIYEDDAVLPILIFRLTDKEAITHLYNLKNTRYLEPYGYWPDNNRSSSGCSSSSEPLNNSDYTTISPNALLPWNYNNCNIPAAWNITQGQGIKIGVIDAGISSSQTLLNSQFNSGESNVGRTITTDYTYGTSAYTSCTHGTSMSGLAAGPRNTTGATSGIAYKSNLHFIRGCSDVVLDESKELSGVKNALVKMGNIPDIKIISMSIGTPFYSSTLYDGVTYAYNKGKMIFAAAGTSFGWTSWWGVIYPAAFSQCIAVTGVNESNATCQTCHDGSKVEFTIPMERTSNSNRNTLSLAPSGSTPTYIGGSSAATSMSAGIAALVWSVKPTLTRAQVYQCIQTTSQYYPTRTSSRGYGNINAGAAVVAAQSMN